ncbi:cysteine desulfurase NifS [Methanosalsum zhilinae DSM 4017]|uniref:Cysteine desulfurase IscS n=2 Tax=Methanosalsum zhilinae TaxID=39669 RepID=F7XKC6_METZD|nr:cysteine desulfurase NifS [Methanosalsum zhilinae DSM 4017]
MDHAATTGVDPQVLDAMLPYFTEKYGNPSSLHSFGTEAAEALENSRRILADSIGAKPEEIVFTSGGTESDNLAIKGIAYRNSEKGKHIITSQIEHPAVLNTCKYLEKKGFEITYVPVDEYGIIDMDELRNSLREDTILITVMHANNEIGTLEPISQISKIAKEKGIYLHTDAVQSVGKIPVNVDDLGVDMLSMSSHKIHGPKGVGALYIRKGTKLEPLLHGGGHERGLRSGTENIAGIVGFAEALSMAVENLDKNSKYILNLRNSLINKLEERIDDLYLNGHPTQCLPNIANIRFSFVEGESMVLMLDMEGVAVSTGSACSSKSLEASHVLKAIGLKPEDSHGSLRFSMGKNNTMEDVDFVVELLVDIVTKLRGMSPLARK